MPTSLLRLFDLKVLLTLQYSPPKPTYWTHHCRRIAVVAWTREPLCPLVSNDGYGWLWRATLSSPARGIPMRFLPFRKRASTRQSPPTVVPFPLGIIEDMSVLKYHGLRALCGALMDRHTAYRSPHPFCGEQAEVIQLIAHLILQVNPEGESLIAIYLCTAKSTLDTSSLDHIDSGEYAVRLTYAESAPSRKMAVYLMDDGTYTASYGPIANPVEGDYSTGSLDPSNYRTLYCNSEPSNIGWDYWESQITNEQLAIPAFHCLQVHGGWWVVDVDYTRRLYGEHGVPYQVIAGIEFTDNPTHNRGIHSSSGYYLNPDDGSEWAKILNENLPRLGL